MVVANSLNFKWFTSPPIRKSNYQYSIRCSIIEEEKDNENAADDMMMQNINESKIYSGSYESLKPVIRRKNVSDLFLKPSTMQSNEDNRCDKQTSPPQTPQIRTLRKLSRVFSIKLKDNSISKEDSIENSKPSNESPEILKKLARRRSLPALPDYDKPLLKVTHYERMFHVSSRNHSLKSAFSFRRSSNDDKTTPDQLLTFLQDAVKQNDCKRVKTLLKKNATTSIIDHDSNDLLKQASLNGCEKCIMRLVKFGYSVNSVDEKSWTALHHAVNTQQLDIVKTLISCNANVNILDADGTSPLHLAVSLEDLYITHELVKNGADPLLCSNDHVTPFQLAINLERQIIMDYFVQLPLFLVD